jgi:L,D-transpeptidase ErfK/SrfK
MTQTRVSKTKTRRQNIIAGCSLVLILIAILSSTPATSQAQVPLFDQLAGGEFSYKIQNGDSLSTIAARFGIDATVLAANNKLSPNSLLKIDQSLRVDNRHIVPSVINDGIVINIPQRVLFYFKDGRLIRHFPVGLGRPDWPTPTGDFKIAVKEEDPTWDVPLSIQEEMRREGKPVKTCVPPGPDNPLGKHWLGLSIAGYGIHGTIAPASIYHFRTHGCIRAHPDDIAGLFKDVDRGTRGVLVYRPLLLAKVGDDVYLEVHRDVYRKSPPALESFAALVRAHHLESFIDRRLAQDIIRKQDGIARKISREAERKNLP